MEKSQCKTYQAHSSHVTKVKFFGDDSKMISTGGNDKTIFVWETSFAGALQQSDSEEDEEEEEEEEEDIESDDLDEDEMGIQEKVKNNWKDEFT